MNTFKRLPYALLLAAHMCLGACALGATTKTLTRVPPGRVIAHITSETRTYIGSPSLAVLPGGAYVASHDIFGPASTHNRTAVYRSKNRGTSWTKLAEFDGQWWSTLFVHKGDLYLLGTSSEYGNLVIRRSKDGGESWTTPTDSATGLLRADGQYHCAPMPVISWQGKLWRGVERRDPPTSWGLTFCAGMLSAKEDADMLNAQSWTTTNFLKSDKNWLEGKFGGWLEGNAVVGPDNQMLDMLRVHVPSCPEKAALVRISPDGKNASFDPQAGFVDMPGGAKKFTVRYDPQSRLYWTLASIVLERYQTRDTPDHIRNTLALCSSSDLKNWQVRSKILSHGDVKRHGFQYVDWLFEGNDIIAACRTAFDDEKGGAHNAHDANYLTFHRIKNFRTRTGEVK